MSAVERQLGSYSNDTWAVGDFFEQLLGFLQRRYMGKIEGAEVVRQQSLYFHPEDSGVVVLRTYQLKVKKLFGR